MVYEEMLRLPRFISPRNELRYIIAAVALIGWMYWSEFHSKVNYEQILSLVIPSLILVWEIWPVLMILNALFFPEMCIQIDESALRLKRGFIRKEIPLDLIIEVSQASPSRVQEETSKQSLYKNSDFLFLDRTTFPNVELTLSRWQSKYVATARPEELARLLLFQAERVRRESGLKTIAARK